RRLETLKNREFQNLIAELFEVPSRRANATTVSVAVVSILISIVFMLAAAIKSNSDNSRTTELLATEANQIEGLRKGVADGLQRIELLNRSVSERVAASEERILSQPQPPYGTVEIEALRSEVFGELRRIEYLSRTVSDQLERSESRRIAKAAPPSV